MAGYDIDALVRDPDFQGRSFAERKAILREADAEGFGTLPEAAQSRMLVDMKGQEWWKGGKAAKTVTGNMTPTAAESEAFRRKAVADTGTTLQKVKELIPSRKQVADFARPALEGTGAALGAIGGAALGAGTGGIASPLLGVAGAATGYASGKYVADAIEGAPQSAPQTIKDLGTGAMYEMGGQVVGKGIAEAAKRAPAAINAVRHPIQTRAEGKAKQVLSTIADLTPQEAANAAKAQVVTSRLGVKLTPAQMTGKPTTAAMEQGLATADPAFAGALNAQDAVAKQVALDKIRQGVGKGGPLPSGKPLADVGSDIAATVQTAQGKAKAKHEQLYKDIPNVTLPTEKIAAAVENLKAGFRAGDESVFPSRAIDRIEDAIKTKDLKLSPSQKMDAGIFNYKYLPEPKTVGFQDLHSLRKDIGRQINDAMMGAQPNRELAGKLRVLKDAIDDTIDLNMGASDKYKAAKDAFIDYAEKYRTGATGKVLQKGRESSGLRLPDEAIGRQFFSESGAKGLVKAVGPKAAKEQMKPYVIADMTKAAAPDGATFNVQRGIAYIQKNRATLERLGLADDAKQLVKDQIPAELERMLAKRAPDAATGSQFFTAQDMRGILQKYGNTIKQMYGPETLQAFRDYNNLMGMIERKNVVPRGGNSNTAEKAMNLANLMIKESVGPNKTLTDGLLGAMAKGAGLGGGATFAAGHFSSKAAVAGAGLNAARQMLANADSKVAKAFVKILQDATTNPQTAKDLMKLRRTGEVPKTLQIVIDSHLIGATAAGLDN